MVFPSFPICTINSLSKIKGIRMQINEIFHWLVVKCARVALGGGGGDGGVYD